MSETATIKLIRAAKYQSLRTAALRLLFTTTPLAVLVVVELWKWPLPKYMVILATDGAEDVLLKTRSVAEARSFLQEYAATHGIAADNAVDVTSGRRG